MRQRPFLPALLLAIVASAAPIAATAQPPRTIVLSFEGGRRADVARDAVVIGLAPEVQLVTEQQAVSTADQIGVDVSTPEGMAAVVSNLGITMVVLGAIEGRGRSAQMVITVVDPANSELARRSAPAADREAITAAAIEAVREAQAVLERQRNPEPEPEPEPPPSMIRQPEPEPDAPSIGWRPRAFVGYVGLRIRNVGAYVTDATGLVHFFTSDAYPEIDLELTGRPWGSGTNDALRGVFFGAQGSFSVGMAYFDSTGDQAGMTSFRVRFDVGYAGVLGDIVELGGVLGLGVEGVQLDAPDGFPSTLYTYLRPGILARVRAVPDFVIVEAGLGGRIGLDGGPLAAAYGPSMVFGGVDLFLGVAGSIDLGFSWAVRFGYLHHALGFSGAGGSFATGVSGTDEAVEGRILIGWSI
jgi:hypothetical protein